MIRRTRKALTIHAVDANDPGVTLCFVSTRGMKDVTHLAPVTCSGCQVAIMGPRLAFCENVTASAQSRIHVRMLTGRGLRPSGGADTMALCGGHVAWDIPGIVNEATLADGRTCDRCRTLTLETWKLQP